MLAEPLVCISRAIWHTCQPKLKGFTLSGKSTKFPSPLSLKMEVIKINVQCGFRNRVKYSRMLDLKLERCDQQIVNYDDFVEEIYELNFASALQSYPLPSHNGSTRIPKLDKKYDRP